MKYSKGKTKSISFPLGGIGTGSIGLAGNGGLIDWEIFNRQNKNSYNGNTYFAIKAEYDGISCTKVLQGDTNEELMGMHDYSGGYCGFGFGPHINSMAGFPHFKNSVFEGDFPCAKLKLSEEGFPLSVKLSAFNPLIPHDEFNSSRPGAFFEREVQNTTDKEISCGLSFCIQNPAKKSHNGKIYENGLHGIFLKDAQRAEDEIGYSDLCVLTDHSDTVVQSYWYRGAWQDSCTVFWKDFSTKDRIPTREYDEAGSNDHGALATYFKLAPKGKETVRFVISWNIPNQYNYWNPSKDENGCDITWKNYYSTQFENSYASASYAIKNFFELYQKTVRFAKELQSCSLSKSVKDAISANLSVMKTATVLRLEDGSLWAWEGGRERAGSCAGSCQHVWNYAYAIPFLFPSLERSLRENTINYALSENGESKFRVTLPLGAEKWDFRACVDGQMGEVIKCYREWKISGDDEWIKKHASSIFSMLEYAWSKENKDGWDADRDGILEGRQHHTLDMELFGPNSWLQGFYLLALDCAAQIASAVGDDERAQDYRALYQNGRKWTNENLFNGEYFCQTVDLTDRSIIDAFGADNYWNDEAKQIKYQVADGCIIDQMLADWHAAIIGNKDVFDTEKKLTALKSLYKYNYKSSMRTVTNMWRNFAIDDERGTIICSYPDKTNAPVIPIPYCEECMTGFEYALAGLMIANGLTQEGETMVSAIRDRYDGAKRNPWNEIECGSNYARSMASFALLPIYSGFTFDMTKKQIGFAPITSGVGRYVWSVASTWGSVKISKNGHKLSVLGAPLSLCSYTLDNAERVTEVRVDGRKIPFTATESDLTLGNVVIEKDLEIKTV